MSAIANLLPDVAARPFLKWAGGKAALLPTLEPMLPLKFDRYFEPFLGGGAMLLYLLSEGRVAAERCIVGDLNADLVNLYRWVAADVEDVITFTTARLSLHSREQYYAVRADFNAAKAVGTVIRAADMLYLNRVCFNGLWRVNAQDKFNVPMGRSSSGKPQTLDADGLRRCASVLRGGNAIGGVHVEHCDFDHLNFRSPALPDAQRSPDIRPGDFWYLDPPYMPITAESFTGFGAGGFGQAHQERLARMLRLMDSGGARFMLSNSDTPDSRALYAGFRIDAVSARRSVSADGARARCPEIVVRNY